MTEHPNLAAALVAALAELTVVDKGRTANAGSYSYDYADLGDIVKVTRPKLAEHGVALLTPVCDHGDGFAVTVIFLHTSGEERQFGPLSFARGRDAQATGSLITYFRRYAVQAALGIATGDDDDGATAHTAAPQPRQEPKTPEHVTRLVKAMNGITDEAMRVSVKQSFLDKFGKPHDVTEDQADEAEMFITNTVKELEAKKVAASEAEQQEESTVPGPEAPSAPVTRPATNKPSAAARAALAGDKPKDKPALGAVKNQPVPDDEVVDHFPGSTVVNEGAA